MTEHELLERLVTHGIPIHLYLHDETSGRVDRKLDQILTLLSKGFQIMGTELATLEAQVKANTDAEQSAVQLLGQLHALLEAAKTDPAKLQALLDSLATSKESLAAAITANTPAA